MANVKFICVNKCWHHEHLYKEGDIAYFDEDREDVPHHFIREGVDPLAHVSEEERTELEELQEIATKLGIYYHRQSGIKTLQSKLFQYTGDIKYKPRPKPFKKKKKIEKAAEEIVQEIRTDSTKTEPSSTDPVVKKKQLEEERGPGEKKE